MKESVRAIKEELWPERGEGKSERSKERDKKRRDRKREIGKERKREGDRERERERESERIMQVVYNIHQTSSTQLASRHKKPLNIIFPNEFKLKTTPILSNLSKMKR